MRRMGIVHPGAPHDLVLHLRRAFDLSEFVETGTFLGETAAWAAEHFARVTTIEGAPTLHAKAVARHGHRRNLKLLLGDSRDLLPLVLEGMTRPALLWLDGHWSDGETFGEGAECPLLDELRALANSAVEHFVLIDDARLFLAPPPPPHDPAQWPTLAQIRDALCAGGRAPYIAVVDDVIVSVPDSARRTVGDFVAAKAPPPPAAPRAADPGHGARSVDARTLPATPAEALARLEALGLWRPGQPLRLHLGCGEQRIAGTIGVDHPPSQHAVMNVAADVFADVSSLDLPPGSVDEVRLHHVFEHFSRVTALGLLARWHRWLKVGGQVRIETPDLMGSARTLVSSAPLAVKLGVARHLAGDHSSAWAYHVDQWFAERFERTLSRLGFDDVQTREWSWPHEPFLSNVEVVATKRRDVPWQEQVAAAEALLADAMVAPAERPTWEVWRAQLRAFLEGSATPRPAIGVPAIEGPARDAIAAALGRGAATAPLAEIHDFNQRARDAWVIAKARSVAACARVLDVGAGTCPYRPHFSHCRYEAHDFKRYTGVKLGGTREYGNIDYESDVTAIGAPDGAFDVVLCTEVLEHVPEPIAALGEMARLVRPGGRILLTAPLGSGLHQLPYHFYGGYTPEWYRHTAARFGLEVVEITPNGGFFKLLAQECARVSWTMAQNASLRGEDAAVLNELFGELLPRYLFALDERCFVDQFTVGYHVELRRPAAEKTTGAGGEPKAVAAPAKTAVGVVFSKDRPMQLDATLRSFALQCADAASVALHVLYTCSGADYERAYEELARSHGHVRFVRERDFRRDLLRIVDGADHVMFVVDDTLFVRPFAARVAVEELERRPDAIGFSLRLGTNTTYCYPLDRSQRVPAGEELPGGVRKFPWAGAEGDFGYPLEVSSSIYRGSDVGPLLASLPFTQPNTLEEALAGRAAALREARPALLCFERSAAFAAPMNRVQATHANRASADPAASAASLLVEFRRGRRIDVAAYAQLVPRGCHQEVELRLTPATVANEPPSGASRAPARAELGARAAAREGASGEGTPRVSVVIPCYEQACFLPEAVESLVAQTFTDWECVIVDDGSPDDTSRVAADLAAKHPARPIRLVKQENQGLSEARNVGVRASRGGYVLPLDADDRLAPSMLSKLVALLDDKPQVAIAFTHAQCFGVSTQTWKCGPFTVEHLREANRIPYCSLYRRAVWDAVGGYNRNLNAYEDWDFWIAAAERGFRAEGVDEALFLYRTKTTSMLTEAEARKTQLTARIVLNHPNLFGPEREAEARKLLPYASPERRPRWEPAASVLVLRAEGGAPLARTLESALGQTFQDFEIVVVDRGSGGGQSEVASADRAGRVRYVHLPRGEGRAAARNLAMKMARGRWAAFVDEGDVLHPDHLARLVGALHGGQAGAAYGDVHVTRGGQKKLSLSASAEGDVFLAATRIPSMGIVFERRLFDLVGGFDESLGAFEDWDFQIRLLTLCRAIHVPAAVGEAARSPEDQSGAREPGRRELFEASRAVVRRKHLAAFTAAERRRAARYAETLARAEELAQAGDGAAAIGVLEAFVRDVPHSAQAHNDLALLYHATGKLGQALGSIVAALELDPASSQIWQNATAIRRAVEGAANGRAVAAPAKPGA